MSPVFILATLALIVAQLALPKKWAFLPLMIAVFHLGDRGLVSEFTPARLVFLVGMMRAISNGSFSFSPGANRVDLYVLLFCVWALITAPFHTESEFNPYTERLGLALNIGGSYLYGKAYFTGPDILYRFTKSMAIVMIPLAIMMYIEASTGRNNYYILGARSAHAIVRGDELRAKGPFGHAIIAGTTGACLLPLMLYLRKYSKLWGNVGLVVATMITFSTASSGPIAAYGVSLMLLVFWKWRHLLPLSKKVLVVTLIFLNFAMSRPVWFLIARIDLVGGSTGWHRSKLIDQSIRYLGDWWLFGTDYTRHWMFSGVSFSKNHTDITNYYLQMGVWGGVPLILFFLFMIYKTLRLLERTMVDMRATNNREEFGLWCLWICIIAQCVSFVSISYFDQTYALFFSLLGMVPALMQSQEVNEAAIDSNSNMSPANQYAPNRG